MSDQVPPNRLREFRERMGLSQAQVAKLLDTTAAAVSRHEGRERRMDMATALQYARLFKVEVVEIFIEFSNRVSKPVVS